ncbi:hypothetical protein [Amycolatopsis balhimycina]|uniref:hypothetical protein n=1 Tax=Amycolatopsis balhimycina TaxID=208443 RepID=UPI00037A5F34|nr:hypothetical protein [Amycolatopsis balhimycina]
MGVHAEVVPGRRGARDPRHELVRRFYARTLTGGWTETDGSLPAEQRGWPDAAYSDTSLVTALSSAVIPPVNRLNGHLPRVAGVGRYHDGTTAPGTERRARVGHSGSRSSSSSASPALRGRRAAGGHQR